MQISQLNRTDADVIKIAFKNVDGSGSITTGMGIAFVGAGASIDGVSATKHTAAQAKTFGGVASGDVPINGWGTATVWGLANSVLFSNVGTSITVTRGDTLIPGAVAGTFFSTITDAGMSTVLYKYVVAADNVTISAAAYTRGIVRAF